MYLLKRIPKRSDNLSRGRSGHSVAIIGGTGALGQGLTRRWTRAGVTVHIGSRRPSAARALAAGIPGSRGGSYREAIARSTVIVLAVPLIGHDDTVRRLARLLSPGQVVVDTTVPMPRAVDDTLRPLMRGSISVAQRTQELLPSGLHVVSALHTVSAATLSDVEHRLDEDVLIAGDDDAAVNMVCQLIDRIEGLRPLHAGALEFSSVTEQLTPMMINLNRRYQARTGIKLTGVSTDGEPAAPSSEAAVAQRAGEAQPHRSGAPQRGMAVADVANLAWQVADFAAPLIDSTARTAVFTMLGAGEHTNAIELALERLAAVQEPLPDSVAARLNQWLECYAGNPDERRLRCLAHAAAQTSTADSAAS